MPARLVTPFTVTQTNHEALLGLLKHRPRPADSLPPVCQVPVCAEVDPDTVAAIVSANDRISADGAAATQSSEAAEAGADAAAADEDPNAVPPTFVSLSAFAPQNRLHQVTTVFYHNFPALKMKYIDQVFSEIAQAVFGKSAFCFSMVSESFNDTRGVFVRFPNIATTSWFQQNSVALFPGVKAVFDPSIAGEKPPVGDDAVAGLAATLTRLFNNKSYYSEGSTRGTEDLDEVMQYYKTYKVENSKLVEVPAEMKETIVMDIIRFRSKVLAIEQEARKKELERERRRAKARLTSIFEGIRSAAAPLEAEKVEETPETAEPEPPAISTMTDEEYDKHLAEQAAKELDEKYKQKVQSMRAMEREKTALLNTLQAEQTYEEYLIENKDSLMEDLKLLQDFDPSVPAAAQFSTLPSTIPAAVFSRLKLYYTDHQEYLRLRNSERSREEAMDKEIESLPAEPAKKRPVSIDTTSIKKQKVPEVEKSEESDTAAKTVVVAELAAEKLEAIKSKISDLVEEFLGIKETVLIDFIYSFVMESNFAQREELIGELQETLDEDSETVVDQLFAYIHTLV